MTLRTVIRSITSTLVFGLMSIVLAAVLLSTVLRTCADYEAKTRQTRYEPARQLKDGSSSVPAGAEERGNGDRAGRDERPTTGQPDTSASKK